MLCWRGLSPKDSVKKREERKIHLGGGGGGGHRAVTVHVHLRVQGLSMSCAVHCLSGNNVSIGFQGLIERFGGRLRGHMLIVSEKTSH